MKPAKRSHAVRVESYSVSESHGFSGSSSAQSSGWSEGYSHGVGISRSAMYDPCVRDTRVFLEWNLEDLGDCLAANEDVSNEDLEWYLAKATRIFQNSLQNNKGKPE